MTPVTPRMLQRLRTAGWIEQAAGGSAQEWWYRMTEAGIAAALLDGVAAERCRFTIRWRLWARSRFHC